MEKALQLPEGRGKAIEAGVVRDEYNSHFKATPRGATGTEVYSSSQAVRVNVICHSIDRYRSNMGYPCILIIWLTRFQILGRKTAYGKGLADRL